MSLYNICNQKLHYLRYAENTIRIYLFYIDEFEQNIKKHKSTKTTEGYTHVSKTYLQSAILPL